MTRELYSALTTGQFEACNELLVKRAVAMHEFQTLHEAASTPEKAACQVLVHELGESDRQLQKEAGAVLGQTGDTVRANIGATPSFGGSYDQQPTLACVDRKA